MRGRSSSISAAPHRCDNPSSQCPCPKWAHWAFGKAQEKRNGRIHARVTSRAQKNIKKKKKQSTCVAQRKQTMKDYAPCRFIMCLAVASCSIFSQDSLLIECTCFEFKTRNFSFSPLFELFFFFSHLLTFGHTFFFFLKLA